MPRYKSLTLNRSLEQAQQTEEPWALPEPKQENELTMSVNYFQYL